MQRAEDGTLRIKEGDADDFPAGTWTGGIVGGTTGGILGLTLGVMGGPLGLLAGRHGRALLGPDRHRRRRGAESVWPRWPAIEPGKTALIAHVTEPAVEVVDTEMERLGGEVVRRPVADVEAEIVAAEDAAMVAEEEARRKLREERSAERKEKVQQKIDELKAKLGGS